MTTSSINRATLIVRETTPRMTPPPASRQFREVLVQGGRAILDGAVSAAAYVPGGNILAAAVRGAAVPLLNGAAAGAHPRSSAESPAQPMNYQASGVGGLGGVVGGTGSAGTGTSATGGVDATSGVDATGTSGLGSDGDLLTREQDMSMRMLRLQEAIGEENRRYTALSNVLHARHEMAKNAIGNIR